MTALEDFPALGFDPAPGELGRVTESAEQYRRVSSQLRFARDAIASIVNQTGIWEGEASEAFARRVGGLPEYLSMATDSMSNAAGALDSWHESLGIMQRHARTLEIEAQRAREAAEAARSNPAFGLVNQTFTDDASLQAANRALAAAQQHLTAATADLEAIIESAERLKAQHAELAEEMAGLLDSAREIAPDDPGLLGRALEDLGEWASEQVDDFIDVAEQALHEVTDFIQDNANAIAAMSDTIGDLSTSIGVVADYLPSPADVVVGGVSLELGKYALAGHVVAKLAGADVSWETITLDAAGLGLGAADLVPGAPQTGTINAALQARVEAGSAIAGDRIETTVGKFVPRNAAQWALLPLSPAAPGLINVASDGIENVSDAIDKDNAGQVERDRQRARERVWE